jgi:hypothetical protein
MVRKRGDCKQDKRQRKVALLGLSNEKAVRSECPFMAQSRHWRGYRIC